MVRVIGRLEKKLWDDVRLAQHGRILAELARTPRAHVRILSNGAVQRRRQDRFGSHKLIGSVAGVLGRSQELFTELQAQDGDRTRWTHRLE